MWQINIDKRNVLEHIHNYTMFCSSQKECETKCASGVTVTKVPATTTQKAATDTAGNKM